MRRAPALLVALALASLLVPPAEAQRDEAHCRDAGDRATCTWTFGSASLAYLSSNFASYPFSITTVTVRLDGTDHGWSYSLHAVRADGTYERVSSARHYPDDAQPARGFATQTDTHVLAIPDARSWVVSFSTSARRVAEDVPTQPLLASSGTFTVTLVSERLPAGEAPSRPAATREDPHVADVADARRPWFDLEAAWLDDALVGDGLLEAHLAVASLGPIDFNASTPPRSPFHRPAVSWYVGFTVHDEPFLVRWFVADEGPEGMRRGCELRRGTYESSALVMTPFCTFDDARGQLRAVFPERSLGSPAPGVPFGRIFARVYGTDGIPPPLEDEATQMRFAFALGGPEVWSRLNPRLDPPLAVVPAWTAAPFHEENLPDTLQVTGALAATLTFLGGAAMLRRRRSRTLALLARVDAVVAAHHDDVPRALLALGDVEAALTEEYRQGRLHEAQYQVAVQRVASAAARLALRKELGLDDGTPGDARPGADEPEALLRER